MRQNLQNLRWYKSLHTSHVTLSGGWMKGRSYRSSGKMPMSRFLMGSKRLLSCSCLALAAFWRRRAQSGGTPARVRIPGNRVRNSGAAPLLCARSVIPSLPYATHNGGHYNIIHKIVRLCSSFALRAAAGAGGGKREKAGGRRAPPGALMVRRIYHQLFLPRSPIICE